MRPMSILVQELLRLLVPFTIVFGLYLISHSHLSPGGGFQGGAVIASLFALMAVVYGRDHTTALLQTKWLPWIENVGLLMYVGLLLIASTTLLFPRLVAFQIARYGLEYGYTHGHLFTAGPIPFLNLAIAFEVVAGLSMVVFLMARSKVVMEK